jgi:hypothetical protein
LILGGEDQYCATGFPMGCYVDEKGNQKDACVISRDYNKADHYYIFNHVDIIVTYHNGRSEDWGKYFSPEETGGRIVSVKLGLHYVFLTFLNPPRFSLTSRKLSNFVKHQLLNDRINQNFQVSNVSLSCKN